MIIDSDASKRPIIIRTISNLVKSQERARWEQLPRVKLLSSSSSCSDSSFSTKTPKCSKSQTTVLQEQLLGNIGHRVHKKSLGRNWNHVKRRHVHKYRGYRIQPFQFCLGKKASMVNIKVDEDNQFMVADMSWTEYLGAFTICCGVCQVKVPLSAVKSVRSVANLWDERRGIRVGSGIPWVFLLGSTWFCSGKIAIHPAIHPAILSLVTSVIHLRTRFCSNIWTKRSRSYCWTRWNPVSLQSLVDFVAEPRWSHRRN